MKKELNKRERKQFEDGIKILIFNTVLKRIKQVGEVPEKSVVEFIKTQYKAHRLRFTNKAIKDFENYMKGGIK